MIAIVEVWIAGIAEPFKLRFHDIKAARAMAETISNAATNSEPRPFVDDAGQEVTFHLRSLCAIRVIPQQPAVSVQRPFQLTDNECWMQP